MAMRSVGFLAFFACQQPLRLVIESPTMSEFVKRVGPGYWLTWQTLRGLFNIFHRIHITGVENIPLTGGVILASNHLSHWDSFAIGCSVPRRVRFVADTKMYNRFYFKWYLKRDGGVEIDRSQSRGEDMIENAVEAVNNGNLLIIYPEGTRSRNGIPGRSRTGIMVIAAKTGAPIVPCRVTGTGEALPVGARLIRPVRIEVAFGKPIIIQRSEIDLDNRDGLMTQSESIMDAIMSLHGSFPSYAVMSEDEWRKSRNN